MCISSELGFMINEPLNLLLTFTVILPSITQTSCWLKVHANRRNTAMQQLLNIVGCYMLLREV